MDTSDNRPVVYWYADPRFPWEIGGALNDFERRGFRVLVGRDPEEVLFLLGMGKPAAVVCALPPVDSGDGLGFPDIEARAEQLGAALIIAGPHDPRDGVRLRSFRDGAREERHLPLHAIGEAVAELDALLPSRPQALSDMRNLARGGTITEWKRSSPPVAAATPNTEEPAIASAAVSESAPSSEQASSSEKDPSNAPVPSPSASSGISQSVSPVGAKKSSLAVFVVAAGFAVFVTAASALAYLSFSPPREISKPPAPAKARPAPMPAPSASPKPRPEAIVRPAEVPAPAPPTSAAPETVVRPVEVAAPESPALAAPEPPASAAPETVPFPSRFRPGTVTFLQPEKEALRALTERANSREPNAKVRVIGHVYADERSRSPQRLAQGRARAVAKFLSRHGIDEKRLIAEAGPALGEPPTGSGPVPPKDRWVEIVFE